MILARVAQDTYPSNSPWLLVIILTVRMRKVGGREGAPGSTSPHAAAGGRGQDSHEHSQGCESGTWLAGMGYPAAPSPWQLAEQGEQNISLSKYNDRAE